MALMALHSASICSGVSTTRANLLCLLKPQYTQEFVQELVIYIGMKMLTVLPKRCSVSALLRRAIVSMYGAAAGEISAMKSRSSRCSLAKARSTSPAVMAIISRVVVSQS